MAKQMTPAEVRNMRQTFINWQTEGNISDFIQYHFGGKPTHSRQFIRYALSYKVAAVGDIDLRPRCIAKFEAIKSGVPYSPVVTMLRRDYLESGLTLAQLCRLYSGACEMLAPVCHRAIDYDAYTTQDASIKGDVLMKPSLRGYTARGRRIPSGIWDDLPLMRGLFLHSQTPAAFYREILKLVPDADISATARLIANIRKDAIDHPRYPEVTAKAKLWGIGYTPTANIQMPIRKKKLPPEERAVKPLRPCETTATAVRNEFLKFEFKDDDRTIVAFFREQSHIKSAAALSRILKYERVGKGDLDIREAVLAKYMSISLRKPHLPASI